MALTERSRSRRRSRTRAGRSRRCSRRYTDSGACTVMNESSLGLPAHPYPLCELTASASRCRPLPVAPTSISDAAAQVARKVVAILAAEIMSGENSEGNQDMEPVLRLVVVFFAALATGGLMVNWIGLGRAMSRLSVLAMLNSIKPPTTRAIPPCRSWLWAQRWMALCSQLFLQGFIRFPGNWPLLGLSVMPQSWRLALPTNLRINKQVARWSVQSPTR